MIENKRVSELSTNNLEQIQKSTPGFTDHFSFFKSFKKTQSQSTSNHEISECLLFLENKKYIGFSHLEGATDIKNAFCSIYSGSDVSKTKNIVEETTKLAMDTLGMLDIIWKRPEDITAFIEVAAEIGLDISIDGDIIIYTSPKEITKEEKETLRYL